MDVDEFIAKAWTAVKKAGIPAAVQDSAFQAAVEFLQSDQSNADETRDEPAPRRRQKRTPSRDAPAPSKAIDEAAFMDALAKNTKISVNDLRGVYHVQDSEIRLGVTASDLGGNKKARVENIAYLLTGAYRFGLGQPTVSTDVVRAEAKSAAALDGNYASFVRGIKNHISFSGPPRRKTLELKPQGEAEFTNRLKRILGQEAPDKT